MKVPWEYSEYKTGGFSNVRQEEWQEHVPIVNDILLLHMSHKAQKSLDDNTYLTMIRIRLKREFKQTRIYLASKFKLCFVIGVVTIWYSLYWNEYNGKDVCRIGRI